MTGRGTALKKSLATVGIKRDSTQLTKLMQWSLERAIARQGYRELVTKLCGIVADISQQYTKDNPEGQYTEVKLRGMHAFQCLLMLEALEAFPADKDALVVADIGDSAGTHMLYLQALSQGRCTVEPVSVNLDPKAIEKIRQRGMKAILKRAEDITPDDIGRDVDLFTSFEMVEHLHDPANFFRRIAKKSSCKRMVVTVPYVRESRVGLHNLRRDDNMKTCAEDEHIFELNPGDWTLLMLHSGWRVTHSRIYYQYPRHIPVASTLLAWMWRKLDYEGFWGAILEKDLSRSDLYQDWTL